MSILDEIRGSDTLDTTVTIKINSNEKKELIKFCERHKISLGKLFRYGAEKAVEQAKVELRSK